MGPGRTLAAAACFLSVVGTAHTAHAGGWYYKWQCSGRCAPGELGISGIEGPYSSESECNSVRDSDQRQYTFVAEGNLGGLGFCEYLGDAAAAASGSAAGGGGAARLTRVTVAMATTPGWTFTRPNGTSTQGQDSIGFELETHFGRAAFGLDLVAGLHGTTVAAPFLGTADAQVTIASALLGMSLSPFAIVDGDSLHVRPTLGLYGGVVGPFGCVGDCSNGAPYGLGLRGKVGLDFYISRTRDLGLSIELVVDKHQLGVIDSSSPANFLQIDSPDWMLRIAGFFWLFPNPV